LDAIVFRITAVVEDYRYNTKALWPSPVPSVPKLCVS